MLVGSVGVRPAQALEAVSVGGQVGFVGLTGDVRSSFNDALGFGADVGFRANALLDVVLNVLASSHSGPGDLGIIAPFATADFHVGRAYDFDFTLGMGPGFYNFKNSGVSETKFGLNFGGAVDVILEDHIRLGLGSRFHAPFGTSGASGSFWTVTMRVGYIFTMD